jgi:hypothetical protein
LLHAHVHVIGKSTQDKEQEGKMWQDCGTYWLVDVEQRTPAWFSARAKRLTASRFGEAVGHCPRYGGPEEVRREMQDNAYRKEKQQNKPQWQKDAMQYGIDNEPVARRWYERHYNKSVQETGFAVPKFDERIGGSPDGLVGDKGLLEIKCPKKMYSEIPKAHFDQIQGCLSIFDRSWCDYVVYCIPENKVFAQRIRRDDKYWNDVLYPAICDFFSGFDNE